MKENNDEFDDGEYNDEQSRIKYRCENRMMEGKYTELNDDGNICIQCYYKNGKRNGECKRWHKNGQLQLVCNFLDGVLDGRYDEWYDNGRSEIRCSYIKGKYDGEYKFWFYNGQLFTRHFQKNGKYEGEYKRWREDGKRLRSCVFENNNIKYDYIVDEEDIKILVHEYGSKYGITMKNKNICHNNENQCLICRLDHLDDMIILNCNHCYHVNCLFKWYKQINIEVDFACPYCKTVIDWKNIKKIEN